MTISGPWIQTRTGIAIDLLDPDPASITLHDLAFALGYINRYTGHAGAYSVAQHSVLVAQALQQEGHDRGVQRAGLLHDAHEAIVGDVASPLKRALRALYIAGTPRPGESLDPWARLEARHERAVRVRFGVSRDLPEAVKIMDLRMLLAEKRDLLGREAGDWGIPATAWPEKITRWTADSAIDAFQREAERLELR